MALSVRFFTTEAFSIPKRASEALNPLGVGKNWFSGLFSIPKRASEALNHTVINFFAVLAIVFNP